jgi:Mannitol repressor
VPDFKKQDEEIAFYDHDSDRAVGVMWAAIVENRLIDVLKAAMRKDQQTENELFGSQGALFNFGTKIRLAYMLGLITRDIKNDLLYINKIRNAFAHDVAVRNFDSQPVCDFIRHLKLIHLYEEVLSNKKKNKGPTAKSSERKSPNEMKLSEAGYISILEMELSDNRSKYHLCIRILVNMLVELEKSITDSGKIYAQKE